jgi:hypothetical protein
MNEERMKLVKRFAARMARVDAVACEHAGTELDGLWTAEHTTSLADHLGCSTRELSHDDIAWAEEAYADEVTR